MLTWTSAGESQNVPGVQHRYRIYRSDESSGKDAIAGEVPLAESGPAHFTDSSFEWEKTYLYRVTAVSIVKRPDGEVQVEGDDTCRCASSPTMSSRPLYPPVCRRRTRAKDRSHLSDLIWAPVTNADLAGYNVYRSEANSAAIKLNSELVKSPSYRDSAVAPGKTYSYAVSAVDVRGNESPRSGETSEPVP